MYLCGTDLGCCFCLESGHLCHDSCTTDISEYLVYFSYVISMRFTVPGAQDQYMYRYDG